MCYGKTTRNTRELAYEMATLNGIKVPESWHKNKSAGLDWMRGFFKRNGTLSIRQPENCSLSRMTSFTRPNVELFFHNLEEVLNRFGDQLTGSRIFNLDETATSTVPSKSVKVIAQKGARTVSNAASAERGILVTTTCIISASGNSIPPAMVIPRVKFRDHMLMNAVPGTLGLASPSGWMSADLFPRVMEHFIKYSLSSKDNPTVLIMDNHASHMSIEAIDMAKNNGVTIITLPPHCSNRLQPLDVTCFAPFEKFYSTAGPSL
ncbi:MFS-type transporter clz9-like [Coccinella septempunctata]|uniref:MFS-type transporter clz9-like n=1 Tax=Coccinella septempunctata TaxID=41139 RepID=UPI001D08054C|nr:MFS-type transporter clz9-like [Coccinella septempunctata]